MVSASSPLESANPTQPKQSIIKTLITSYGPLSAVSEFLSPLEKIKLQALNRLFYDKMVP